MQTNTSSSPTRQNILGMRVDAAKYTAAAGSVVDLARADGVSMSPSSSTSPSPSCGPCTGQSWHALRRLTRGWRLLRTPVTAL